MIIKCKNNTNQLKANNTSTPPPWKQSKPPQIKANTKIWNFTFGALQIYLLEFAVIINSMSTTKGVCIP